MPTKPARSRRGGTVAAVSQRLYRALFPLCQRLGFHLTPNHFYQPIPDTRTLDDSLWDRQSELVGIDMRDEKQLLLLATLAEKYKDEYERLPRSRKETSQPHEYYLDNPALGPLDAEMLYAMIRHFAPKKVVEIGAGFTTRLTAQAIGKNATPCELVSIDPYPPPEVVAGLPGLTRLLRQPVQSVPLAEFERLGKNDILLIDSSHVLKIGSDVQHEYLEILPRLGDGVVVHIHDIFLPLEYPIEWVRQEYRFFNEQYLLQAFLTFNSRFEVLWAGGYMALKYPTAVKAAFPNFDAEKCWPGSFWMRKTDKQEARTGSPQVGAPG